MTTCCDCTFDKKGATSLITGQGATHPLFLAARLLISPVTLSDRHASACVLHALRSKLVARIHTYLQSGSIVILQSKYWQVRSAGSTGHKMCQTRGGVEAGLKSTLKSRQLCKAAAERVLVVPVGCGLAACNSMFWLGME